MTQSNSKSPHTISLAGRKVGAGHPCFITFEGGPTHDGLASAKRLVTLAADAGADAVKFQLIDPDRLVADRKLPFTYDVLVDKASGKTETVTEPLYDILARRALSHDQWRKVKAHSDKLGLAFFATAGFHEEIDFLAEIGCQSIKIASADINHTPLLRYAARTGICLQIDTGNATIGEVETAVETILAQGNNDIIIHQCPSGYPAHLESINLNVIPTLARMFGLPIAFSDHTPGWDMDIAAIALGASLIEKTITEDRMTRSVEHVMSLEPDEMRDFIKTIRNVETAFGSNRRVMSTEERSRSKAVRRSAHVARTLTTGSILTEADLDYRRPGFGIPPTEHDGLVGARLITDKENGAALSWSDIELDTDPQK